MRFEECPKRVQLLLVVHNDVSLCQSRGCHKLGLVMDSHIFGVTQRQSCKVFDAFGLCGGEKQRLNLARRGQIVEDTVKLLLKAEVKNAVCLVEHLSEPNNKHDS